MLNEHGNCPSSSRAGFTSLPGLCGRPSLFSRSSRHCWCPASWRQSRRIPSDAASSGSQVSRHADRGSFGAACAHERLLFGISLAFAVWRTAGLWQGGRRPRTTTAVLYLPTIAGSIVSATVASAFGHSDNWGQLAFGVGMVLLARLAFKPFMVAPAFLGGSDHPDCGSWI